MQRRTRKVIAVVAIVVASPFVLVTVLEQWYVRQQVQRLRRELESAVRAAIPVGTHKNEVMAFFDRIGWEHSFESQRRLVHAVKHELGADLIVDTALSVTVELDEDMKVRQVRTAFVMTGP